MKKILVTKSSMPDIEEYIGEIKELWETHWLTNMGIKHETLQKDLQEYLSVKNLELVVNGHMALELALQALNFKKNSKVITTPFTFASTTHAIIRSGLEPVFCDINPCDFTIDVSKIENLIDKETCAILPVHVYGNICNVEEIDRISQKYGLKVIYDAAHAFGVKYKNKSIANMGDISCFSFHATKVFNSIEGGAICCNDEDLQSKIYALKNFGIINSEEITEVGTNAKMNEFCAAMGICNLRHIEDDIKKRKHIIDHYTARLRNKKGIRLNIAQEDVISNYSYFPIIFEEGEAGINRDKIYEKLMDNNIFARKYFYPLTKSFDCFDGKYEHYETPIALEISKRVLTLPLYVGLEEDDVDRICDLILEA